MDWQTETYTAWLEDIGLYCVVRGLKQGTYNACLSRGARVVSLAHGVSLGFAMTRCEQHAGVYVLGAFFARCQRELVALREAV